MRDVKLLWSIVGHGRDRGSTLGKTDVVRLVESSARFPSVAGGKKGRTRVTKRAHSSRREGIATSGGGAPPI